MAQHKLVKAANGTGIDGVAASTDATSITTDELWVIVSATATRESAIANLKDILYYMEGSTHAFPFA
jgi:hypothetical protein